MQLFDQQATDTAGLQDTVVWQGGKGNVVCEGVFDSCTVSIQARWNGGAWHTLTSPAAFTAAGIADIELRKGFEVRGSLASAGGSTLIDLYVIQPEPALKPV